MSTARRLPLLGRKKRAPILFDDAFYRAQSADLHCVGDGWKHYCMHGFRENRNPHPLFNTAIYRDRYLAGQDDVNPVLDYLEKRLPLASPHPLFDAETYADYIGGIPSCTLLEHYLATPVRKLAPASVLFDSQAYLNAYPDVADSNSNPLMHFLRHGIREKRATFIDGDQLHKLFDYDWADWLRSAPYVRPSDFLFKFIHAHRVSPTEAKTIDIGRPTVLCVARDAGTSFGSRMMAQVVMKLRAECTCNVASLLVDSGEQVAKFEASGPTVVLDQAFSTEIHTSALLQYFASTVRHFNPIGAIIDSAVSSDVQQAFANTTIPVTMLNRDADDSEERRIDSAQIQSIRSNLPQNASISFRISDEHRQEATSPTKASNHSKAAHKRVFFLSPSWEVSGVNTFTELLCRELNKRDYEATVLLTEHKTMSLPAERLPKVPYQFLHATRPKNSIKNERLVEFLTAMAPAVVLPNFDYRSSMVASHLPESVQTMGILHSDDSDHYTHGYRMGHSWERIVSVSDTIERKLVSLNPAFANKSSTINYGVDAPEDLVNHVNQDDTIKELRIVYSGRLVQQQKRILDFADLLQALKDRDVPFQFTMIGDGQEADELRQLAASFVDSGQLRMLGRLQPHEVYEELLNHHAICLMSDYEGLPLSLLEGLACGCIPVMTQIESGVSEILTHHQNAMMSPLRSPELMADNLHQLFHDNELRKQLAATARPTLVSNGLTSTQMVDRYDQLLSEMFESMADGVAKTIPPFWRCRWVNQLLDAA